MSDAHLKKRVRILGSLRYVGISLLITTLLVLAKIVIEGQLIGHEIEIGAYRFLQEQLSPFTRGEYLQVVVVNKSEILVGSDQATPREPLKRLIDAISAYQPSAIALDIDFSPNEHGWITDNDPDFFDFCLKIRNQKAVPLYLGVYRTMEAPSDTWLGLDRYKDLAAAIALPDDTTRIPRWVQVDSNHDRLPSMSSALAQTYKRSLPAPPNSLVWALELTSDNNPGIEQRFENRFVLAKTLSNYSKLEQMQHETVSCTKEGAIAEPRERFLKKMVIIGNASQNRFTDAFVVSGRALPVAGVYIHGCAAYTLAVEPLYELRGWVRLGLDFFVSGLIILGVGLLRFSHPAVNSSQSHRWHSKFVWTAIILTIVVGIMLMRWLSIMWLDFFLVVFALFLHPRVEDRLKGIFRRLWPGKQ